MSHLTKKYSRCEIDNRIKVEGMSSSVVPVTSGSPQGNVLSPLLFIIHINDLAESITSSVKLFAENSLVAVLFILLMMPSNCCRTLFNLNYGLIPGR